LLDMPEKQHRTFTLEEVALHNQENSCWIVIKDKVYDCTQYLNKHPGGKDLILRLGGKDCTKEFYESHRGDYVLTKYKFEMYLGDIKIPASL
jgi:cytochrome b involved in lipid metabolism